MTCAGMGFIHGIRVLQSGSKYCGEAAILELDCPERHHFIESSQSTRQLTPQPEIQSKRQQFVNITELYRSF